MGEFDRATEFQTETAGTSQADDHVHTKRKALLVGSIALLTGAIAGTMFISSFSSAQACPDPPCPAPSPAPAPRTSPAPSPSSPK